MTPSSGAVADPPPTFTLEPVSHENLQTAEERQAAGYYYGPEGVLGVVPGVTSDAVVPGTDTTRTDLFTFVGSNGIQQPHGFDGRAGRFTGTLAKPFATEPAGVQADDEVTMANTPSDIHFTAPSKIYEASGYWLTVVHSERYYNNPISGEMHQQYGYYSTLGMAKSTDQGATWTYLGEIIKHKTTMAQCQAAGNISTETGSGPWIIVNVGGVDYFYVYYMDKQTPGCGVQRGVDQMMFAVARAKVSDVLTNAASGTTTSTWVKYNNGWGSEPGLGGAATDLAGTPTVDWEPAWYDVSYNTYLGKYIVISTGCATKWMHYSGDLCYRDSTDGITWSTPITLTDFGIGFNVYPTIVGLGSQPGRESGKSFYIYYLHAITPQTIWVEGSLWRVKVTIN